uniref:Ig-like domain-containing protein n=1 Tax=Cyprinus carpio TaxID=7962 RepID=A0A8C1W692_CYPCA
MLVSFDHMSSFLNFHYDFTETNIFYGVIYLFCLSERLLVSGSSRSISASVGEDVTLNCSVDSHITLQDIEQVSWKKTDEDEEIQVLLYQDNEILPEASDQRYSDRVEFFRDEIPKFNFSLRLKSVRTEDKGVYMCEVLAGGLSANTTVELERLGFSVSHIMVLILCVSASGSALLLCCLIYCRSLHKGFFGQQTYNHQFNLGSSVVLPCHVDECLLKKNLKVEWRRKDTKTLVHLYEDGESRAQQDYQDRAHFFTDQIQHGNFSLRLDDLRAEDAGEYTCNIYSDLSTVTRTAETSLVPQFKVKGSSGNKTVPLGGSVVLLCQVDKSLLENSLKVEWRRADSETLVHLYEDGESRPKKQHKDYQHRAQFITEKIKDGNFSLRLDKLRAEDAGKYTCKVYSEQDCVHSADAELEILRFAVKCSRHTLAPLGSSVVLPSYGDKSLPVEGLRVDWRKGYTTVHLYEDGQANTPQQDYQDRACFFTDEFQSGNFSLRLDDLRAEDAGEYTCRVYSNQRPVFSAKTNLVPRLLDPVFRLHMSLVFCPNVLMLLAVCPWGVSEGQCFTAD